MPDIAELPPASKIRHLRFDKHMTYAAIADMYGIPMEMVYRLAHASDRVIDLVEDDEEIGHS